LYCLLNSTKERFILFETVSFRAKLKESIILVGIKSMERERLFHLDSLMDDESKSLDRVLMNFITLLLLPKILFNDVFL
jgi:hypothetical protein